MKNVVTIVLTVLLFACQSGKSQNDQAEKGGVTPANQFKELIDKYDNEIVLDIRTQGEVDQGFIPDAIHIDFYGETFKSEIAKLDKTKPVFVYCAAGGRSGKTYTMMKELGFEEVYDLQNGFPTWVKAGYPVSNE